MYLSRIELFGFKSFANRVRIRFDKGLTAIVGPNGCGKTNVVDAIRWVLGEQKSSLLRSAKMENIIFNGTKRLKPLSFTEVSLCIENTRNVLPTEYTEVTITRRIYRSGESDFLLNQVPCRLKDILDLFTDTGMGSDAYSVIELKMIEEIISNKSEERLKLFEEAAGITRYKQRRRQTFRQLETTSRDLCRVDDLLAEVEKKVRSLKIQVRKAEKLRELKQEIRQIDLSLSWLQMEELGEKLDPLRRKITEEKLAAEKLAAEIATADSSLQKAELEHLELENRLSEEQKRLNDSNAHINERDRELLRLREQQSTLAAARERAERGMVEKEERLAVEAAEEKRLLANLPELEAESAGLQRQYRELAEELEALNATLASHRNSLQRRRAEAGEGAKELNRLEMERQSLEARSSHLEGSLSRLKERHGLLLEKREAFRPKAEALKTDRAAREEALREARSREDERRRRLEELETGIAEAKERLLGMRASRDRLQNAILLADSVLDNYEGMPEGVAFLEKRGNVRPGMGCLSDLLSLQAEHRKAVNAALGEWMNYYVSRTTTEAHRGIEALRNSNKGKVHFLVLDLVPDIAEAGSVIAGATRILDLLSFPPELQPAMTALLDRSYLADDLEAAEMLAAANPGCTIVTPEGEKCSHNGVVMAGSPKSGEGLRLGRKAERDRLKGELSGEEEAIGAAERELAHMQGGLGALRSEEGRRTIDKLETERSGLERQLARLDAEEESLQREIEGARAEEVAIAASANTCREEIEALAPSISACQEAAEALQGAIGGLQQELSVLETRYHDMGREVQARQSRHRDAQLELEKRRIALQNNLEKRTSLQAGIDRLGKEASEATEGGRECGNAIATLETELEELRIEAARRQQALNELESTYRQQQGAQQLASNELRDMRRKLEVARQLISALEHDKSEMEQQLETLFTTVRLRHDCDLAGIDRPSLPEGFEAPAAGERLETLQRQREQFGAVNELALEEFEIERERLEFLHEQKEDLVKAEGQLRDTIEEINRTALQKFQETYREVRKNFITIFHELFDPQDEADLIVHAAEDPLEAHIEIVAKPRGKKPLSIEQLSGGEKALTALSLLFAIYLVKPSPFCILDEVDAPLDDANVGRFIKLLKKFENNTQFIIVTHNKNTMASCQALYGVTMEEEGVSKLIPVRLEKIRQ